MRRNVRAWIRACAGLLAVAVALTLAAPPAWAGEAASPAAPQTLRAATAVKVASLDTNKALRFQDAAGGGGSNDSKGFFRTPKGVAAAVLLVGGITWMLVSRSRDIVHSPGRK